MSRPSIAVVGGGVIGLSTALALADRGVCVTVFEPGDAGAQSSWAGAGILFPLLPWDYDDAVNRWCEAGIAAHPAWLQRLQRDSGIDPEHRASGMRIVGGAKGRALEWLANRRVAHQSLANGDL
ncbi:MAG: FAD-binding oxidoreductase, partial [Betaproteobacteria bacterium]|nr:FAD-binding oxidoreductase [Betaproteobacteria bacterium]